MTAVRLNAFPRVDDRPTAAVRPVRAVAPLEVDGGGSGLVRLGMHLTLAALPLLAISAHVFGVLPMHLTAALVVLPLTVATGLLVLFDPIAEERIVLHGAVWGIFATVVYDVFRLDTVYLLGWWDDFIPTMGTWVIGAGPDQVGAGAVVGYLWRYLGDGAGIGAVFFVLAAATGLRRLGRWPVVGVAVGFAVFPVWAGLIATVAIAPRGQQQMFPLTATTVTLSLVGHLIFGVVLGLGCARTPDLERDWPHPPLLDLDALVAPFRGPVAVAAHPAALPSGGSMAELVPDRSLDGVPERPWRGGADRARIGPAPGGPRTGGHRVAAVRESCRPAFDAAPAGLRPVWWDGFDAATSGPFGPPPSVVELTMPVPPPRAPSTPSGGIPVAPVVGGWQDRWPSPAEPPPARRASRP